MALTTSMRNLSMRCTRRFNISFWCGMYNIFLFAMMVLSLIFSGTVMAAIGAVNRVKRKLNSQPDLGGDDQLIWRGEQRKSKVG